LDLRAQLRYKDHQVYRLTKFKKWQVSTEATYLIYYQLIVRLSTEQCNVEK
jgi:hypothetical protein